MADSLQLLVPRAKARSENQHLVGGGCRGRELVHGASLRSLHELGLVDATRIQAGAAEKHAAFACQDALEHALDIVKTVGVFCFALAASTASAIRKTITS
jgi:hypothetical protein